MDANFYDEVTVKRVYEMRNDVNFSEFSKALRAIEQDAQRDGVPVTEVCVWGDGEKIRLWYAKPPTAASRPRSGAPLQTEGHDGGPWACA